MTARELVQTALSFRWQVLSSRFNGVSDVFHTNQYTNLIKKNRCRFFLLFILNHFLFLYSPSPNKPRTDKNPIEPPEDPPLFKAGAG